ncbi:MAG: tungstate ABC transporter substrate-binding protein WtpA [Thermodesulfobacteriota bacterium]|nr:tungstate ABC transporter substrate-binding protein WtpA [Thermodesulfobacteriota bacterium]
MKLNNYLLLGCTIFILFCTTSLHAGVAGKVTIFHAGSLALPLAEIEKAFEARYPAVDIQRESSGSQKAARKISELGKPCDIMASADYRVIDKLLRPLYTDNNIRFASNQMVLCYTEDSRYADSISADNWMDILQQPEVVWGHSEPDLDPCGYRALMVLQLAERYYKQPNLYAKVVANRPLQNVRPKAVELVSLLQSGNMDYAWEYRSVAVQHGLKYLQLPQEINLGNYLFDGQYAAAKVEVSGKTPGSTFTMQGKSITYGIALLKNAPNPEAASAFLCFMLDKEGGLKILSELGQPPFIPARVSSTAMLQLLPSGLQPLLTVQD